MLVLSHYTSGFFLTQQRLTELRWTFGLFTPGFHSDWLQHPFWLVCACLHSLKNILKITCVGYAYVIKSWNHVSIMPLLLNSVVASYLLGFPGGSDSKSVCLQCWRPGFNPWVGKIPLEKEMATHSSTLAWKIPWTEEPGWLHFHFLIYYSFVLTHSPTVWSRHYITLLSHCFFICNEKILIVSFIW